MEIKLPKAVQYILDKIDGAGFRADVVGGPVRDFLLGEEPHDYDITTSASPAETERIFEGHRLIETGIKHGTVTLVIDGESYEITTYRIDGEYLDSRHPESVEFTTELSEDLSRRDFTMNALAYNPKYGITDCHGGREDIRSRLIRAVGDPKRRFTEDALRILRGIRFASVLGFEIEPETAKAMRECAHLLKRVSAERIFTEWKKLLSGDMAYEIISEYRDVISVFLPEIGKIAMPPKESFMASEPLVRQLTLFATLGGDVYRTAMQRLRTDSATRDVGALVLSSLMNYRTDSELGIKLLMSELGAEIARIRLKLEFALGIREREEVDLVDRIIEARKPYRISDLDICGQDVVSLGFKGAAVGSAMRDLLNKVMAGKLENRRAALLSELKSISK